MAPLLEIDGLYKSFGGLMAINGIDSYLDDEEILGLIGPNGSGKTTSFNLIAGIFKPEGGQTERKCGLQKITLMIYCKYMFCASGARKT